MHGANDQRCEAAVCLSWIHVKKACWVGCRMGSADEDIGTNTYMHMSYPGVLVGLLWNSVV